MDTKENLPFDWFLFNEKDIRSHMDRFPDWIRTCQPNMEYDDGGLPLHTAVTQWKSVDMNLYKLILESYPEASQVPYKRPSCKARLPLHIACDVNLETERFKLLIEAYPQGAFVADRNGCLPIHMIGDDLSIKCLEMLLDANPKCTQAVDQYGKTVLHRAVERGYPRDKFKTILSANPDASKIFDKRHYLPIHAVDSDLDRDCVEMLLRANPESLQTPNRQKRLPLHSAIIAGCSLDILEMMVNIYPEALRAQDEIGNLPLHWQIICKNYPGIRYVEMLVSRCPESLRIPNHRGQYALHEAVSVLPQCDNDVINFILNQAPETCRNFDSSGLLPLHLAIMGNSLHVVEQLIEIYPDSIRCRDSDGRFPLHVALQVCQDRQKGFALTMINEHSAIVKFLFEQYPEAMNETMIMGTEVLYTQGIKNCVGGKRSVHPLLVLTGLVVAGRIPNMNEAFIAIVATLPKIALVPLNECGDTVLHLLFGLNTPTISMLELCRHIILKCPEALGVYSFSTKGTGTHAVKHEECTPLQVACKNSALLMSLLQYSDLQNILQLNPEAAIKRKTDKSLPLLLACANNAPLDIIFCLLEYSIEELL